MIPTARAARLTMDREGIRRLAAETLGVPTSKYRFADTLDEFRAAIETIGMPCVVKPVMSSSGKGQSVVRNARRHRKVVELRAGRRPREDRRAVIVEGFIDFEYEITLLTLRTIDGTSFCAPIGHRQVDGDYVESWQPQPMSRAALEECERIALLVTNELGGRGIFGVEFFIRGDEVWFSEVSPRPHDTGMVTMISQDLSEFALHARAILGAAGAGHRTTRSRGVGRAARRRRLGSRRIRKRRSRSAGFRRAGSTVRQTGSTRQTPHGCCACGG